MYKSEILAPVGSEEQLLAAVRSGADAVTLVLKVLMQDAMQIILTASI